MTFWKSLDCHKVFPHCSELQLFRLIPLARMNISFGRDWGPGMCDKVWQGEGGQHLPKIAWRTLWTAPEESQWLNWLLSYLATEPSVLLSLANSCYLVLLLLTREHHQFSPPTGMGSPWRSEFCLRIVKHAFCKLLKTNLFRWGVTE